MKGYFLLAVLLSTLLLTAYKNEKSNSQSTFEEIQKFKRTWEVGENKRVIQDYTPLDEWDYFTLTFAAQTTITINLSGRSENGFCTFVKGNFNLIQTADELVIDI